MSTAIPLCTFLRIRNRAKTQDINFVQAIMDQVRLRKNLSQKEEKWLKMTFMEVVFLPFNFGTIFDLLNIIIWTSSPSGNLSKIKFSSQVALNRAIFMDRLKVTD